MMEVAESKLRQRDFLLRFTDYDAPEPLKMFSGWDICFAAAAGDLPREEGEVYLFELVGLEVRRPDGTVIGEVEDVLETGAHVLLQLSGPEERLIPFSMQYVPQLDLIGGYLVCTYPLEDEGDQ